MTLMKQTMAISNGTMRTCQRCTEIVMTIVDMATTLTINP